MIHKPGKPEKNPGSYRPISLLPSISKVFERLISARMVRIMEAKGILSEHQFGFRAGHCTTTTQSGRANLIIMWQPEYHREVYLARCFATCPATSCLGQTLAYPGRQYWPHLLTTCVSPTGPAANRMLLTASRTSHQHLRNGQNAGALASMVTNLRMCATRLKENTTGCAHRCHPCPTVQYSQISWCNLGSCKG